MENKFLVQHRNDNIVVNCRSLKPILEGWDLNGIEFGVMAPNGLRGTGLESINMNSGICNGKLRDVFKETGYPRVELSDETPTYDYTEDIRSLEKKCQDLNVYINTLPENLDKPRNLDHDEKLRFLDDLLGLLEDLHELSEDLRYKYVDQFYAIHIDQYEENLGLTTTKINKLVEIFSEICRNTSELQYIIHNLSYRCPMVGYSELLIQIFRGNLEGYDETTPYKLKDLFSKLFGLNDKDRDLKIIKAQIEIDILKKEIDIKKQYNNTISVLGEYHHETRSIVLYYKNIEKADKYNKEMLMKVVYLHELVHAILDPVNKKNRYCYVDKVEEPIAEYGMLCLCAWIGPLNVSLDYALKHVKTKQQCLPISHYGLGYYLYEREELDFDGYYMGRILVEFLHDKKNFVKRGRSRLDGFADKFKQVFLGLESYPHEHQADLYKLLMSGYRDQDY